MERGKGKSEKEEIIFSIQFSEEAASDIQDSYDWYEEQQFGFGEDFVEQIEKTINEVLKRPLAYQNLGRGLRKICTKKFPFGIYYRMNKEIVQIIGVIYLARHSRVIKRRYRK